MATSFRFLVFLAITTASVAKLPQSPFLENVGSEYIYGGLKLGDTREEVLSKLRKKGFIQIYEERDEGVVRCAVRWDGFRYELVSKLEDNKLNFALLRAIRDGRTFISMRSFSKNGKI